QRRNGPRKRRPPKQNGNLRENQRSRANDRPLRGRRPNRVEDQHLLPPRPGDAIAKRLSRVRRSFLRGKWAGLDSNQRRRKASRFTVCPVWPLRYLPSRVLI